MNTQISIRMAVQDEAGEIRDVVRAAYSQWVAVIGREPRPMQADYEKAVREHRFDVIEEAGRIVALIETEAHGDHFWIENIAVLPEAQGRGLGRQLLDHAEMLARAAGLLEMRLLTNGKMAANRRLYGALGYIEEIEESYGDGTVVKLSKRLAVL